MTLGYAIMGHSLSSLFFLLHMQIVSLILFLEFQPESSKPHN